MTQTFPHVAADVVDEDLLSFFLNIGVPHLFNTTKYIYMCVATGRFGIHIYTYPSSVSIPLIPPTIT
jgi:hypothetical protein